MIPVRENIYVNHQMCRLQMSQDQKYGSWYRTNTTHMPQSFTVIIPV